jgi:hyperosmotically inducible periplasmic protein
MNRLGVFLVFVCMIVLNAGLVQAFTDITGTYLLHVQNPASQPDPDKKSKVSGDHRTSGDVVQSPALTLKLALMADPRLFPYDIECQIQEKTVELTGVVAFEEEKILAALLTADAIKGKKILNHLEVRPALHGTLQAASDARLTELVKQRFTRSQTLTEANFEVITIRGIVSLRGQTRFQVIALEAAQAAREIPGIVAVNTQNIRIEGEND